MLALRLALFFTAKQYCVGKILVVRQHLLPVEQRMFAAAAVIPLAVHPRHTTDAEQLRSGSTAGLAGRPSVLQPWHSQHRLANTAAQHVHCLSSAAVRLLFVVG